MCKLLLHFYQMITEIKIPNNIRNERYSFHSNGKSHQQNGCMFKTNTPSAYLHAQLWRVVRVRHLGTDVEAEIRVVFDVVVAHAYCRNASYGHHLLQ